MLLGTHHVSDSKLVIVDHAGQMIQRATIGARDHVVLFGFPSDTHRAANQILDDALTGARHLQTDRGLTTFGLKFPRCRVIGGHPTTVVKETLAALLGRFTK